MSRLPSNLRIGIIGAGYIGEPLARHFTQAGHAVKIANSRGPETLAEVAQRTGATAVAVEDAVKEVDLIVVTIPEKSIPQLGEKRLFHTLPAETIVIDTGNYYPDRDGHIAEFDAESVTESRWVEKHLGHPVLKVFNNIGFPSLANQGKPAGTAGRIALPVAGDNAAHKATVIALLDQIGFDGVDAGSLDDSWRQQPGTPVYCTDHDVRGVQRELGRADRSRSHAVQVVQTKAMYVWMGAGKPVDQLPTMGRELMAEQYGK